MSTIQKERNIDEEFDKIYFKIKESLTGLKEIFDINFLERNFYRQAGMDNIEAIHNNVIELLKHKYSPRKVRMKLREIEYDELEAQNAF